MTKYSGGSNNRIPVLPVFTPATNCILFWSNKEAHRWTRILFAGTVCLYAARVALPICVVSVSKQYNWSKTDSGLALSSFFWGYTCTQLAGGWLADRYGGERVLMISGLIWSVLTLLFPFAMQVAYYTSSPMFIVIIIRVLLGACQGTNIPSIASVTAARLRPSERTRAFGTILAGCHLGTLICGSIGSYVQDSIGWEMCFYLIGSMSIVWWLCLRYAIFQTGQDGNGSSRSKSMFRRSEDPLAPRLKVRGLPHSASAGDVLQLASDTDSSSTGGPDDYLIDSGIGGSTNEITSRVNNFVVSPSGAALATMNAKMSHGASGVDSKVGPPMDPRNQNSPPTSVPWLDLFNKAPFWAAIVAHYCGAYAFFTLFSWLPSYFEETFPDAKPWVFNVLPSAAILISSSLSPVLAARMITSGHTVTFVRKLMEGMSLVGLALSLLMVGSVSTFTSALLLMMCALFLRGFHHAGVAVNAQDFAPNHAGSVFGFQNTAGAIPGFVGTFFAGFILERYHSWNMVFAVTAVQCLIGAVIYCHSGTGKQII